MAYLIDRSDLESRVGAGEVSRYSRNDSARVTDAISKAHSRMRSEVVKVYSPASWDALTRDTFPGVAAIHLISDAIDLLSTGSNRLNEAEIAAKADEARLFRIRIARGEELLFDDVLARTRKKKVRGVSPETNYFRDEEDEQW